MFWDCIKNKLEELGATQQEWSQPFMQLFSHDDICGIKGELNGCKYSIISHRHSYGGNEGLFEVMPDVNNKGDVTGYMSESEVFDYLEKMAHTNFFK